MQFLKHEGKMEILVKNNFVILEHSAKHKFLKLTWLPESRCISNVEFLQQIQIITFISKTKDANILFADCYDFNFPIPAEDFEVIQREFSATRFQLYGIVVSQNLIGRHSIHQLLNFLITPDTNISIFKSRADAGLWYSKSFIETLSNIYNN